MEISLKELRLVRMAIDFALISDKNEVFFDEEEHKQLATLSKRINDDFVERVYKGERY